MDHLDVCDPFEAEKYVCWSLCNACLWSAEDWYVLWPHWTSVSFTLIHITCEGWTSCCSSESKQWRVDCVHLCIHIVRACVVLANMDSLPCLSYHRHFTNILPPSLRMSAYVLFSAILYFSFPLQGIFFSLKSLGREMSKRSAGV